MNYVYDLTLNFNKDFFDFFEWNINDKITHIKKIPIIKVSNNDFYLFKNSIIRFKKNFTKKIYNKTEEYSRNQKYINYAFLISNGYETIGLKLNKKGISTYKSSLLLDEENEFSNIAFNLEKTNISYYIIKKYKNPTFKTRKEKKLEKIIINSLNTLYKNKEISKIKFLYQECFNTKENNLNKIYYKLKKEISKNNQTAKKMNIFFEMVKKK